MLPTLEGGGWQEGALPDAEGHLGRGLEGCLPELPCDNRGRLSLHVKRHHFIVSLGGKIGARPRHSQGWETCTPQAFDI